MSKKKKKRNSTSLIVILVLIVLCIILFLVLKGKVQKETNISKKNENQNETVESYVTVLNDGTRLNNSSKLNETKQIKNYEISNIQLAYRDDSTVLLATVKNNSSSATEKRNVKIVLKDKEENTIIEIPGIISNLQPGETTQLNCGITIDCTDAYDFNIIFE